MKKCLSIFSLLTIATFFLFGCRKTSLTEDPVESKFKRKASTETLVPPDVYVVGADNAQAMVWKNGVGTPLTGGAEATGIVVVGTDVYICGWAIHPTTREHVGMYWKNGVQTVLSDGTTSVMPNGIAVSGSDVYVSAQVGILGYESVYYLNGVPHALGTSTTINRAWGVVTDANGNFYIPGARQGFPSYWLNGTLQPRLPGGSNVYSFVNDMAVQGGHVYAVGYDYASQKDIPLYWKDGQTMTIGGIGGAAKAVAVRANGDPVIAGTYGPSLDNLKIAYWPMLVPAEPPVTLSVGKFVRINVGVAVDQTADEIYVCGTEDGNQFAGSIAKYWKISNGGGIQAFTLHSNGAANAIALGY
jgi:hypothetical protein